MLNIRDCWSYQQLDFYTVAWAPLWKHDRAQLDKAKKTDVKPAVFIQTELRSVKSEVSCAGLPLPWVSSLSEVVRCPSETTDPQSTHTHCLWEYRSSSTTLDEPHSGQLLGIPAWETYQLLATIRLMQTLQIRTLYRKSKSIKQVLIKQGLALVSSCATVYWSANNKLSIICTMERMKENHTVQQVSKQTDCVTLYYWNIWASYWWRLILKWSVEYYYERQSKCVVSVTHKRLKAASLISSCEVYVCF